MERAFSLRDAVKQARVQSLVGRVDSLPSVPIIYLELLEELKNPQTSFKTIGAIISKDVAMTAKILQLVNSAFFGFYRNITSVDHAVGILGMRMIRSLVLSVKVFSEFSSAKMAAFPIEALMNHSVSTGALARIIAKAQTKDAALVDDAFMSGMLHDVGKLILADKATEEYAKIEPYAREKGLAFHAAEQELLGVTHADVGAHLMGLWGLPEVILETIAYHHQPSQSAAKTFGALTVVHVANVLEHREHATEGGLKHEVDTAYLAAVNMADRLDKWAEICHVVARGDR